MNFKHLLTRFRFKTLETILKFSFKILLTTDESAVNATAPSKNLNFLL